MRTLSCACPYRKTGSHFSGICASSAAERRSLKADVRGSSPRRAANIAWFRSGSRAGLQNRTRGFDSRPGIQAPVARAERHRSSKSAHAGSKPAWSPTHSVLCGRVAQRMSADFLHRRMHVRFVSRSPTWRVNWAGAQRRLLSDRPARR